MNSIDQLPGPRPMRAEYRSALRKELETVVAKPTRPRLRMHQLDSWTHRAVVIAVATAIVVVFFVPLPHVSLFHRLSQSQNPASLGSITPSGWVPVVDGAAQMSVPAAWSVLYDWPDCPFGKVPGLVLVDPTPTACAAPPPGDVPKNVIELYRYVPDKLREHLLVINGITVYGTGGNWYDVPSLGIAIAIQGPLGGRVLHTLTRSPQGRNTTTTAPKPLPVVDLSATPKGWVPVAYGDAQLSVPPGFPVVYPGLTSFCKGASAAGPGGLLVDIPPGETVHCVVERHPTMVYFASALHPSHIQKKALLLNGVRVHRILTAVTYVGYYAPSLGVQVIAEGPLAKRILATLTSSPRAVALAPGSAPAVQSDWKTLTFQGLAFTAPSSWPVMRTSNNLGIGQPCGTPGVALSEPGVVLSTDKQASLYFCSSLIGPPAPQTAQDGIQVDAGSDTLSQWNLHVVFSAHCLSLHGLTACPATSPAYSILVLRVRVPGRSKPVYVSIGLAGNGMVARTILYSLRAATAQGRSSIVTMPRLVYMPEQKALQKLHSLGLFATVSTVAAPIKPGVVVAQSPVAGRTVVRGTTVILKVSRAKRSVGGATESHWWVTLVFANSRLGVVAEGSGVEQAAHCDLSVYATSDGGASWSVPVLVTRRASCNAGGSTDEMAITTDGHWFLATPQGLFKGQVNRPGSELVQVTHLDRSTPTETICSIAAFGIAVWLTLADSCGLRSPSILLYSGNDGATWTHRTAPLGFVVDSASTFATPPDSLAATGPESLWLIGSATANGRFVVARTTDASRTWLRSTLPCKYDDSLLGFLTIAGESVAALCLGGPTTGFEPMEVLTSSDAGLTWVERCANGPNDLVRIVGSCPGGGYPSAIAAVPDGVLVMSLGYPVGGVDVSVDGGRTWKLALRTAGSFLDNSQGVGADWILAVGPTSPGVRLAESTNGRTWRQVALP